MPRNKGAFVEDVTTAFAPALSMMVFNRSFGCDESKSTKAAPSSQYRDHGYDSIERLLKTKGIRVSCQILALTSFLARQNESFSRSNKVKLPSHAHMAGECGERCTCRSTRSCTQESTFCGKSFFHIRSCSISLILKRFKSFTIFVGYSTISSMALAYTLATFNAETTDSFDWR